MADKENKKKEGKCRSAHEGSAENHQKELSTNQEKNRKIIPIAKFSDNIEKPQPEIMTIDGAIMAVQKAKMHLHIKRDMSWCYQLGMSVDSILKANPVSEDENTREVFEAHIRSLNKEFIRMSNETPMNDLVFIVVCYPSDNTYLNTINLALRNGFEFIKIMPICLEEGKYEELYACNSIMVFKNSKCNSKTVKYKNHDAEIYLRIMGLNMAHPEYTFYDYVSVLIMEAIQEGYFYKISKIRPIIMSAVIMEDMTPPPTTDIHLV